MQFEAGNPLPAARLMDLVTTESGDSLLVYDLERHALHTLNPVAATVWRFLDGERTAKDILAEAHGTELTLDTIRMAIITLSDAKLLTEPVEMSEFGSGQSRRRFLKKAAIGASIPAIISVTAPLAAAAATGGGQFGVGCQSGWVQQDGTGLCSAADIGSICCNSTGSCGTDGTNPLPVACGVCAFNQWNCQNGYYMQPYTYGQGEQLYSNGQIVGNGANNGQCVAVARCQNF